LPLHFARSGQNRGQRKIRRRPALGRLKNFGGLKDAIGFGAGAEVGTADYRAGGGQMNLIVVEYYGPQSAAEERRESGIISTPFLNRERPADTQTRRQLRHRNVEYSRHARGAKYYRPDQVSKEIYWAGRSFTDIPLAYRPPDPLAVEDMTRTIKTMVRSFYWTGIAISARSFWGLPPGSRSFNGSDIAGANSDWMDMFSDAGGSIRLNLDDYLLPNHSQISGAARVKKTDSEKLINDYVTGPRLCKAGLGSIAAAAAEEVLLHLILKDHKPVPPTQVSFPPNRT